MAGKAGRSGRRPLSIEHHLAAGTYRRDRHGPKPARVAVAQFPAVEPVPAPLVADLDAAGGAFVAAFWREYKDWTAPQQLLLTRAGQLVDFEMAARATGDVRQWTSIH